MMSEKSAALTMHNFPPALERGLVVPPGDWKALPTTMKIC